MDSSDWSNGTKFDTRPDTVFKWHPMMSRATSARPYLSAVIVTSLLTCSADQQLQERLDKERAKRRAKGLAEDADQAAVDDMIEAERAKGIEERLIKMGSAVWDSGQGSH